MRWWIEPFRHKYITSRWVLLLYFWVREAVVSPSWQMVNEHIYCTKNWKLEQKNENWKEIYPIRIHHQSSAGKSSRMHNMWKLLNSSGPLHLTEHHFSRKKKIQFEWKTSKSREAAMLARIKVVCNSIVILVFNAMKWCCSVYWAMFWRYHTLPHF